MELSMRPVQTFLPAGSDASSPTCLIEYALQCARQGDWNKAGYFFQLASEQLSLMQEQFIPELNLCIQYHVNYIQAQQDLHRVSKQFVQAESALEDQLLLLEKLLPALKNEEETGQGQVAAPTAGHCPAHPTKDCPHLPPLHITCFGHFEVRRSDHVETGLAPVRLPLCQNRNGQTILRFLIAQSGHRASVDTLMDLLWPNNQPAVARRKLQIAMSALRCSLNCGFNCDPGSGYILCKDRVYQLNPTIPIYTDVAEFLTLWEAGRQQNGQATIDLYEKACHLRFGPFLIEDLYADWSSLLREQLNQTYLTMCHTLSDHYLKIKHHDEAVKWTNAILKENRCDERAHRQLMRIYTALGRRSEALRQYQLCERILNEELRIPLMPETVQLFHTLLAGQNPQS